ncbi:glucose-6-phosphate isomerase [Gemmatimonas sp. UBA7669]|uniref:glucose-6-phosphate isomerase n=1 Tax=Gemmatimonas sp. UBA7669 TaxID=1946568 RepID=UPI0025C73B5E|nr:glucose-6-phosphate isomerase [Gemmatimonas sp. UBA7669]
MSLNLDFTNMMAAALPAGQGITLSEWENAAAPFAAAHAAVHARTDDLGFLTLPNNTALLAQSEAVATWADGRFTDVLLLGIGGSALGPIALRTALCAPQWNALTAEQRGGKPRLHVLDNVDPASIAAVLARLSLANTLVLVVSKSGGTVETMAQYLIVREALALALGEAKAREHVVFVTDPAKGALRAIANAEGVRTVDIPANVGGRFSVLSPVGVLPAALLGIDVRALLAGAGHVTSEAANPSLGSNLPGAFAVLQWLADTRHGRHVQVLMPYADPLRDLALWFVQLWAESLGKIGPDGRSVGPTPLPALGATDQHSQVQLFMEGPRDKTVTFVAVRGRTQEGPIPARHADIPELGYLAGHTLGELLDIEQRATAGALAARGRLNATLTVDAVDAWHMGALMQTFALATAYAGALYGIDAFDQPGVELGKQFAYAMLGRAGSEAARAEWDALPHPDPRFQL